MKAGSQPFHHVRSNLVNNRNTDDSIYKTNNLQNAVANIEFFAGLSRPACVSDILKNPMYSDHANLMPF